MYKALLILKYLRRKLAPMFAGLAVMLCTAMVIIVISVMGGFLDTIRTRAHGLMGDLVMDAGLTGFPFYQEFMDRVRREPGIESASPVIHSYGILRFPLTGRTKAVEVRGIRLAEYQTVNQFGSGEGLYYNRYYPGTTTFQPAGQPFFGVDASDDRAILPESFESGWRGFVDSLPAEERARLVDRWERVRGDPFRGPGVFDVGTELHAEWSGRALPGVIIGRDIIAVRQASGEYERPRRYPRGVVCQITLMPVTRRGQLISSGSPPAPLFRYVDDSRTGVYEIDNRTVYVAFDYLQSLLSMTPQKRADGGGLTPSRCTQVQIKLAPDADLKKMKRIVQERWRDFQLDMEAGADADDQAAMANVLVSTYEELQRDFIAAIQKEKVLVVIMFGIISIVAVLLVLCIFYMIVVEKTRDIGILKSVGGSAQGVAAVFLIYGAAIGVVGAVLGSIIGATFVRYINEVQDWLARLNPEWRIWSPQTYSFDRIPDTVKPDEVIWIAALAIIASIIGAVVPAIRASRTWPVEALRYE
ncbi:MAG: FtsX-like permease family protein [Phycisphaerae bacterium]